MTRPALPVMLAATVLAAGARASVAARAQEAIRDNSFLVEEAYNQERGVVQHINTFMRFDDGERWTYTFTQEWPLFGQRHQIGYTIPLRATNESPGAGVGLGDVALNYRFQIPLASTSKVAIAPRVSVLLPTGAADEQRGAGATGVQLQLPMSLELSRSFVMHLNAGSTWVPGARNAQGDEAGTVGFNLGQSLIWLARPTFNVLLEAAWSRDEEVVGSGTVACSSTLFIAPGVRGALNFHSGLQIVPGIAVPFGVGPSAREVALFVYLSFEHPFDGGK